MTPTYTWEKLENICPFCMENLNKNKPVVMDRLAYWKIIDRKEKQKFKVKYTEKYHCCGSCGNEIWYDEKLDEENQNARFKACDDLGLVSPLYIKEIANKYNISVQTLGNLLYGDKGKHLLHTCYYNEILGVKESEEFRAITDNPKKFAETLYWYGSKLNHKEKENIKNVLGKELTNEEK